MIKKVAPAVAQFIRANKNLIINEDWDRLYSDSALTSAGLRQEFKWLCSVTNVLENAGYDILKDIDYIPNYFQMESSRDMPVDEIPSHIKYLGKMCYYNTFWKDGIIIPEGVRTIGELAFANCYATPEILIPKSIEWIKKDAFYGTIVTNKVVYYSGTINQWENQICYTFGSSGKKPFEGTGYIIHCSDGEISA